MAVLQAFLDESGTHPETPVVGVAGFYGSEQQWDAFKGFWCVAPEDFHAKNSPAMFGDICSAIERSEVNGVLLTIGKSAYTEFANAHLKTAVGNAYSVSALLCVKSICSATTTASDPTVRWTTARLWSSNSPSKETGPWPGFPRQQQPSNQQRISSYEWLRKKGQVTGLR